MIKTLTLAAVLTATLVTGALAAPKQHWSPDNYNSTVDTPSAGERLFDRAKGNID
jgi:hypothetical protein